jgi:hypothetical protein
MSSKPALLFAVFASCLSGQTNSTYTSNFAYELKGTPDSRPGMWGGTTFYQNRIIFHPLPGIMCEYSGSPAMWWLGRR